MKIAPARPCSVFFAALFLAACSGGGTPDTTAPAVVSYTPAASAASVGVGTAIDVTFTEPVRAESVNADTFRVETGGLVLSGTYTTSGRLVRFTPLGGLATGSSYTVTLTTGIRDLAGNPLAGTVTWDFSTASLGTVELQWTPSRARGVNMVGGGYKVYYSTTSGFTIDGNTPVVDVPWNGGTQTPSTVTLDLPAGNYYFRVVAYSALGPGGSRSEPTAQKAITIR